MSVGGGGSIELESIKRHFPPQQQQGPYVDWACAEMARHLEMDPDLLCGMELETYVKTMAPYYWIAAVAKKTLQ
jgi:hypothetical protein